MLDHLSLGVRDLALAGKFYTAALAPLGIRVCERGPTFMSFDLNGSDDFSIHQIEDERSRSKPPIQDHIAFKASSREAVDAFHSAAVLNGGVNDGEPGLRVHYHAHYYAAFVIDPDGHRLEAVCHKPP